MSWGDCRRLVCSDDKNKIGGRRGVAYREVKMSELFRKLCEVRGVGADFLAPKYEDSVSLDLPDMGRAIDRILKAAEAGEKIVIYGDYDVDGVTATALMNDVLREVGVAEIECILPDRFMDGYGMNMGAVEGIVASGAKLVVTVDCGSGSEETIATLLARGVETIVTDHHEVLEVPKSAVAVVNPKLGDGEDMKRLAGVGVVFKMAQEMVKRGLIKAGREKWWLDLVAIGTICDSMDLVGENRRLVKYGLMVLEKTRRVGLRELMRVAGVKRVDSFAVGYMIGPRLNAGGRLESAYKSLRLLMSSGRAEAAALAEELQELNMQRREVQAAGLLEIDEMIDDAPVVVVRGKWHQGIVGIMAGRVMERYSRPAIVFAEVPDGLLKGSGRSFGEFDLSLLIASLGDLVVRGGGHKQAAGMTILAADFDKVVVATEEYYRSLGLGEQSGYLRAEPDLVVNDLSEMGTDFYDEMLALAPYGQGNREPLWRMCGEVAQTRWIGKDKAHFCMFVRDGRGVEMKMLGWSAPREWEQFGVGAQVCVDFRLRDSEWQGTRKTEGEIVSIDFEGAV